jgi:hypothetical protein
MRGTASHWATKLLPATGAGIVTLLAHLPAGWLVALLLALVLGTQVLGWLQYMIWQESFSRKRPSVRRDLIRFREAEAGQRGRR